MRYSRDPIRLFLNVESTSPEARISMTSAQHSTGSTSLNCAAFYTKAKGGSTDFSFHICKSVHWGLCDDFNTSISNFHTYPKSGFWRIPRTPWFLAIDGVILLGKLRRVSPRNPPTLQTQCPPGGYQCMGLPGTSINLL